MPFVTTFRDGIRYRGFVDDGTDVDESPSPGRITAPPVSPPRNQTTTKADPVNDFSASVAKLVATGMPRDRAINAAAAADPGLHGEFIQATDGQRHDRLLNTSERATIKSAWSIIMTSELQAAGGDRLKAAASAARNHPELHRQYLRATNPGRL